MSDNFGEFIKIIVVVVVALFIGGAAFGFWAVTSGFIGKATDKVSDMGVTLDESDITQYEGAVVSGTQVVAVIKNLENEDVCVEVVNGRTTGTYIYTDESMTTRSELNVANAQQKTSEYYINPNGKFLGSVIRDEATGGTITKLVFTIQTTP